MLELDLTQYQDALQLKTEGGKRYIFGAIRKKWLVLQPEEMVRQLMIQYLIREKAFNRNRIIVERGVKVNKLERRCDIIVYGPEVEPFLLVECKSPKVKVRQEAFEQAAWYNMPLRVRFVVVTNGIVTYCYGLNYEDRTFEFLDAIPGYPGS